MDWKGMLSYISGSVDEEFLLRNEYLVAENRVLRNQLQGRLRVVSKNTNELKTGAPGPFRSSSTRGEPQIWGSEAMSAIRVPRTRRENTVQQRDATLPGGDLDPGLYLRVHAGIRHLWRSPTQASQLTLAFKRGVATLDSGSTGTGRDGDARRSVRSILRIISCDSP